MDVSVFSVIFNDFCLVLWVLMYFTWGEAFFSGHGVFLIISLCYITQTCYIKRTREPSWNHQRMLEKPTMYIKLENKSQDHKNVKFVEQYLYADSYKIVAMHDVHKTQSQSTFSIGLILVRTDEVWRTYSPVQQSLCNTLAWDVIITSCRTETETVSRMEKAGPFDVDAAISQWHRRLSTCVRAHGGLLNTFCDRFVVQCGKLALSKFLH